MVIVTNEVTNTTQETIIFDMLPQVMMNSKENISKLSFI